MDATALTSVRVRRSFIRVREPSPATDVIDKDGLKARGGLLNVIQQ